MGLFVDPEGDVPGADNAVRGDPPPRLIADGGLEDEQDGVGADAVAERERAVSRDSRQAQHAGVERVGGVEVLGVQNGLEHAAD